MIAYHFPPLAGSSGIQRTLRFVQHLPDFGWQPMVLTTDIRAYERTGLDLESEIPTGTVIRRAFALDTARHLSIAGRHLAWMARPDRWASWKFDGTRQGLNMIAEQRPDLIFSTYPIATAHVIALALHRRSGIPWVADFRDPMAQNGYPPDPKTWAAFKRIEEAAAQRAWMCLFTTPGAAQDYRERYPEAASRIKVLENGYDEESFAAAERLEPCPAPIHDGLITLLHSGIVYPSERDPTALLSALKLLKEQKQISAATLRLRFRAPVHDGLLQSLANEFGISDIVEVLPAVSYAEAVREMRRADTLVVMQASSCNAQIPAKVYEYLRAARPILCLSDSAGDTSSLLRAAGIQAFANLASTEEIATTLAPFLVAVRHSRAVAPATAAVGAASRHERARQLAHILDAAPTVMR